MVAGLEAGGDLGHQLGPGIVRQLRRLDRVGRDPAGPLGGDENVHACKSSVSAGSEFRPQGRKAETREVRKKKKNFEKPKSKAQNGEKRSIRAQIWF